MLQAECVLLAKHLAQLHLPPWQPWKVDSKILILQIWKRGHRAYSQLVIKQDWSPDLELEVQAPNTINTPDFPEATLSTPTPK